MDADVKTTTEAALTTAVSGLSYYSSAVVDVVTMAVVIAALETTAVSGLSYYSSAVVDVVTTTAVDASSNSFLEKPGFSGFQTVDKVLGFSPRIFLY